MNRRNFLHLVAVGAVLAIPIAAPARPLPKQADKDDKKEAKKEEKSDKKAEHQWNSGEDKYYRQYLSEKHEKYRDYDKLNHDEQEQYWSWRDAHRDDDHDR